MNDSPSKIAAAPANWRGVSIVLILLTAGGVGASLGLISSRHSHSLLSLRPASVPRLVLSTPLLDLGEGKPKELVRGVLVLRNAGYAPLDFTITHGCGCTELQPKSGRIEPSGEQQISIAIELKGYHDDAHATSITISTNDAESPEVSCALLTRCPAPLIARPAFVAFGELSPHSGQRQYHEVRILGRGGKHLLQGDLPLRIREEGDWFKVVEPTHNSEGRFSLSVSITRLPPLGHLTGAIVISPADSEESIRVPITAHVVEPIGISPTTLYLRRKSVADTSSSGRFLLVNRIGEALDGELTVLSAPLEPVGKAVTYMFWRAGEP